MNNFTSNLILLLCLIHFQTPDGIVKKQHWEAVITQEGFAKPNLKVAHILTPTHLNPTNYQKMNVPLAFQVSLHIIN